MPSASACCLRFSCSARAGSSASDFMPRSGPDRAALMRRGTVAAMFLATSACVILRNGYWLGALTEVFLIATIAQSINIIAGFTGYAAFGQVVFFGLGNYAAAIAMTTLHAPFVVGA